MIGHPVFTERLDELTQAKRLKLMIKEDTAFLQAAKPASSSFTFVWDDSVDFHARALIIYTSGTTGKPKGAVSTHFIINAQTSVLVKAWYWTQEDRIHHILPLHHIHGVVNALLCPLYCGATIEMHAKFDAAQVWTRWSEATLPRLTVFMSVPTVYAKLTQYYKKQESEMKPVLTKACKQFRFMVSGSASLPTSLRNDWRKLSGGQVLLERYGMTG
jgi:acyl-CoA synthetase (AMP-forming)/AMP-acid ligase II